MNKIAIIGASGIGGALAKILIAIADHEIVLIDSSEEVLTTAYLECVDVPRSPHRVMLVPAVPVETYVAFGKDQLEATLRGVKPDVVACATYADATVIADIANRLGCHYLDFNMNEDLAEVIRSMNVSRKSFVPQTGLVPGFASYIGMSLFRTLGQPLSLDLRVGALPQVSFSQGLFAITSTAESLVDEYTRSVNRKIAGCEEIVPALDDHETISVNGIAYEAFTTAGGLGDIAAFADVPSVEFKSIRYPGHLEFLQKLLSKVDNAGDAVELMRQSFVSTRDDVVVVAAQAVDTSGRAATAALHFYPSEELNLSAYELTTAGTGAGIIELMLDGSTSHGVLNSSQIPFDLLLSTNALKLVFEHLN